MQAALAGGRAMLATAGWEQAALRLKRHCKQPCAAARLPSCCCVTCCCPSPLHHLSVLGLHGADAFHVDPQTSDDPVEVSKQPVAGTPITCCSLRAMACTALLLSAPAVHMPRPPAWCAAHPPSHLPPTGGLQARLHAGSRGAAAPAAAAAHARTAERRRSSSRRSRSAAAAACQRAGAAAAAAAG